VIVLFSKGRKTSYNFIVNMSDRLNTLTSIFDPRSPRISAYNIHEWIHDTLRLAEEDVSIIPVDGPKRCVYIKITNEDRLKEVLKYTNGLCEYKHENGEISQVRVEVAGMGTKKLRIAGLPPEIKEHRLKNILPNLEKLFEYRMNCGLLRTDTKYTMVYG